MAEGSKTTDDPPVVGADGGIDPQTLEIARILRSLDTDITEEKSMPLLKEIITKIAHESVHDRNYNILTDYMRQFVFGFSVQFSVSKTNEIIKILLVIWNQQNVARYVIQEVYNEDIGAAEKPIDPDILDKIPKAVKQLDDKATEIFFKALLDGEKEVKNILFLMVVGMFGVGKTSFVNNRIRDFRDKNITPLNTDGIDLHRCQVMEDGDWCLDKEHKSQKYIKWLQSAFNNTDAETASTDSTESLNGSHVEENRDADPIKNQIQTEPVQKRVNVEHHEKDDFAQVCSPLVEKMQNDTNNNPSKDTKVSLKKTVKEIAMSVWDFAGQTLYYSTHQFFLNKRSIYLVIMDMTKHLNEHVKESDGSGIWCGLVNDCTYLDVFKFWLNAIHMYSGYKTTTGKIKPNVILVGTRKWRGMIKTKNIQ